MTNKGFTLAEVLITLGVIGVVSALTLPTLIKNYQKKTWVEDLKVGVSILEQGFKKAMADDGVDDLKDTTLWNSCYDDGNSHNNPEYRTKCSAELNKYFKTAKIDFDSASGEISNAETCKNLVGKGNYWYILNDKNKCFASSNSNINIALANGMLFEIYLINDEPPGVGEIFALDINGNKGPNAFGRDAFSFVVISDGSVTTLYSETYVKALDKIEKLQDFQFAIENIKRRRETECNASNKNNVGPWVGQACSARVISEGWVMNY